MKLKKSIVSDSVKRALLEDGYNNDLSLKAKNINTKNVLKASLISREDGILSGSLWFEESFKQIDKKAKIKWNVIEGEACLLYTSPSPRDVEESRMPSSA